MCPMGAIDHIAPFLAARTPSAHNVHKSDDVIRGSRMDLEDENLLDVGGEGHAI